jgi:hypothetical protein
MQAEISIFSSVFIKQAYRLEQLAFPQVGGLFVNKSALNNKKTKKENIFARSKNLTTKTEIVSSSFLRQIYRFGQRVKSHVGGLFVNKSAIDNKKTPKEAFLLVEGLQIISLAGLQNINSFGAL